MEVSKFYFFHLNIFIIDELQKLLEDVRFSQKGTTEREKEEATYMFFLDLLHSCEGVLHVSVHIHKSVTYMQYCFIVHCRWHCSPAALAGECIEFFHRFRGGATTGV